MMLLPEGHLAHFISDAVDGLDLSAFHAKYGKDGPRNQPFHPAMMVKVLVYDYATGVFSSRKIARKLHEDVAFRVLAAANFPAHRTIRDFRAGPPQGVQRVVRPGRGPGARDGSGPEQTLADAGYRSEAVFEQLAERTELIQSDGRIKLAKGSRTHYSARPTSVQLTIVQEAGRSRGPRDRDRVTRGPAP